MKVLALSLYGDDVGGTRSTAGPFVLDFGRLDDEQPSLRARTGRLERAYDRASASPYEAGWEEFVAVIASSASEYEESEIAWLLDRVRNGCTLPFRRALALVHAASAIAVAKPELSSRFSGALTAILAHSIGEVRAAALEATSETDLAAAKHLAQSCVTDPSLVVRETAQAILAMTQ